MCMKDPTCAKIVKSVKESITKEVTTITKEVTTIAKEVNIITKVHQVQKQQHTSVTAH